MHLNHKKKDSIWLIIHKKSAENPTISWSEAVDEALCFGWIDSVKKPIDNHRYKQYFSKRKAVSTWSKINKDKIATFIEQGLITDEGYKSVEIAKKNGSWSILDDVEALIIPNDLKDEFKNFEGAKEYFESLSKSNKKSILQWIIMAKRKETRDKRIQETAKLASKKLKPKQFS